MTYEPIILPRLLENGFTGRTGHPGGYDAIDRAARLIDPESYLEIGVLDGASALTVINAAPKLKRIVLCDAFAEEWQHLAGGSRGQPPLQRLGQFLNGHMARVEILQGNSNSIVPTLKGPFDLITVDGSHDYNIARNDILNTLPLLRVGGLLVWDDSSRGEMQRITAELLQPAKMRHVFTVDDGADATSVYEKVQP